MKTIKIGFLKCPLLRLASVIICFTKVFIGNLGNPVKSDEMKLNRAECEVETSKQYFENEDQVSCIADSKRKTTAEIKRQLLRLIHFNNLSHCQEDQSLVLTFNICLISYKFFAINSAVSFDSLHVDKRKLLLGC